MSLKSRIDLLEDWISDLPTEFMSVESVLECGRDHGLPDEESVRIWEEFGRRRPVTTEVLNDILHELQIAERKLAKPGGQHE